MVAGRAAAADVADLIVEVLSADFDTSPALWLVRLDPPAPSS